MNRWLKGLLKILVILGVTLMLCAGALYVLIFRPMKQHSELAVEYGMGGNVSEKELRESAHRSIRWFPNHDALVTLLDVGDQSSIPYLVSAIRFVSKPDEDGAVVCTSNHCLKALQQLTDEDFGYDASQWRIWWDSEENEKRQ